MNYRLRNTDEGLLVLQVGEYKSGPYNYDNGLQWRDAKVTDIPVYDLFKPDAPDCRPVFDNGASYGGIKKYADTPAA